MRRARVEPAGRYLKCRSGGEMTPRAKASYLRSLTREFNEREDARKRMKRKKGKLLPTRLHVHVVWMLSHGSRAHT